MVTIYHGSFGERTPIDVAARRAIFTGMEQEGNKGDIVPLYAARIEHLTHARSIAATCQRCGHVSDVPVSLIRDRLPDWFRLSDVPRVLRCVNCDTKGEATIDARHALGHDKLQGDRPR
jgi:hypothetical protein